MSSLKEKRSLTEDGRTGLLNIIPISFTGKALRSPGKQTNKRKKFLPASSERQKDRERQRKRVKYSQRKLQRDKPSNAYTLKPVLHTRRWTRIIIHVCTRGEKSTEFRRAWNSSCSTIPYIVWGHRENWFHRVPASSCFIFYWETKRGHFNRRCNASQPKALLEANRTGAKRLTNHRAHTFY